MCGVLNYLGQIGDGQYVVQLRPHRQMHVCQVLREMSCACKGFHAGRPVTHLHS